MFVADRLGFDVETKVPMAETRFPLGEQFGPSPPKTFPVRICLFPLGGKDFPSRKKLWERAKITWHDSGAHRAPLQACVLAVGAVYDRPRFARGMQNAKLFLRVP